MNHVVADVGEWVGPFTPATTLKASAQTVISADGVTDRVADGRRGPTVTPRLEDEFEFVIDKADPRIGTARLRSRQEHLHRHHRGFYQPPGDLATDDYQWLVYPEGDIAQGQGLYHKPLESLSPPKHYFPPANPYHSIEDVISQQTPSHIIPFDRKMKRFEDTKASYRRAAHILAQAHSHVRRRDTQAKTITAPLSDSKCYTPSGVFSPPKVESTRASARDLLHSQQHALRRSDSIHDRQGLFEEIPLAPSSSSSSPLQHKNPLTSAVGELSRTNSSRAHRLTRANTSRLTALSESDLVIDPDATLALTTTPLDKAATTQRTREEEFGFAPQVVDPQRLKPGLDGCPVLRKDFDTDLHELEKVSTLRQRGVFSVCNMRPTSLYPINAISGRQIAMQDIDSYVYRTNRQYGFYLAESEHRQAEAKEDFQRVFGSGALQNKRNRNRNKASRRRQNSSHSPSLSPDRTLPDEDLLMSPFLSRIQSIDKSFSTFTPRGDSPHRNHSMILSMGSFDATEFSQHYQSNMNRMLSAVDSSDRGSSEVNGGREEPFLLAASQLAVDLTNRITSPAGGPSSNGKRGSALFSTGKHLVSERVASFFFPPTESEHETTITTTRKVIDNSISVDDSVVPDRPLSARGHVSHPLQSETLPFDIDIIRQSFSMPSAATPRKESLGAFATHFINPEKHWTRSSDSETHSDSSATASRSRTPSAVSSRQPSRSRLSVDNTPQLSRANSLRATVNTATTTAAMAATVNPNGSTSSAVTAGGIRRLPSLSNTQFASSSNLLAESIPESVSLSPHGSTGRGRSGATADGSSSFLLRSHPLAIESIPRPSTPVTCPVAFTFHKHSGMISEIHFASQQQTERPNSARVRQERRRQQRLQDEQDAEDRRLASSMSAFEEEFSQFRLLQALKHRKDDLTAIQPINELDAVNEKLALMDFFHHCNGRQWTNSTNWGSDLPVREWFGVHVTVEGYVFEIHLPDNNLEGNFPESIDSLSRLEVIHFDHNRLSGVLPDFCFQRLRRLRVLSIRNNQLSGVIPFNFMADAIAIQEIWLNNNQFSGELESGLVRMKSLTHLALHNNQLTGELPTRLSRLIRLRFLSLSCNQFTGRIPASIIALHELEVLSLHSNQLSGTVPEWIYSIPTLHEFEVYHNKDLIVPETFKNHRFHRVK